MKKLVYLLAPMMCFSTLVSCGGEGDKPGPTPDKGTGEEFCFTSLTDNSELDITFIRDCENKDFSEKQQINLQYKINDGDFKDLNLGDLPYNERKTVQIVDGLKKNDKVYLRGDNKDGFSFYNSNGEDVEDVYYSFCSNENSMFDLSGNIMSLISSKEFSSLNKIPNIYCFQCLFESYYDEESVDTHYINIKNAKDLVLPANDLTEACYYCLFDHCNTLENSSKILPAVNIPTEAYAYMFAGCESLISTPNICAQQVGACGMSQMFADCTSLTSISDLCFTKLEYAAVNNMFNSCTSLTNIPLIPTSGVTLGNDCYAYMFSDCENLSINKQSGKMVLDTTGVDDLNAFDGIFRGTKNFPEDFKIESAKYYI